MTKSYDERRHVAIDGYKYLERVFIDRDNPYIRMSADGNFVLTTDGRTLLAVISDPEEIRIPEGQLLPGRARSSDGGLWEASPVGPLQAHRTIRNYCG